jgi:hypothetical protein
MDRYLISLGGEDKCIFQWKCNPDPGDKGSIPNQSISGDGLGVRARMRVREI